MYKATVLAGLRPGSFHSCKNTKEAEYEGVLMV
jgi:hypothetical protein